MHHPHFEQVPSEFPFHTDTLSEYDEDDLQVSQFDHMEAQSREIAKLLLDVF